MATKKLKTVGTKTATLELRGTAMAISTTWCESLDEIYNEVAAEVADGVSSDGGERLELSSVDGRVVVGDKVIDIDFLKTWEVEDGSENTWAEFVDAIGIYSLDVGEADCSATFSFSGKFDPRKLTFHCKTAIGPGYLVYPTRDLMWLLDRVEYDGIELALEYGDMHTVRRFTVFNKGKFAPYKYGCGVDFVDPSALEWKEFGTDDWFSLGPEEWVRILSRQPQFADKCKKWKNFGTKEWVKILRSQPQFADRCDKWSAFTESQWHGLLLDQPQFADRLDQSQLTLGQKAKLLDEQSKGIMRVEDFFAI